MAKKIITGINKRREKINFFKIDDGLSSGALGLSKPNIIFYGGSFMSVEGCKGIMEYGETVIKLNLGKESITISGEGLGIISLSEANLSISGKITAMEFCK